jgi:Diacylglycerol kinase catalytic domain
MQTASDGAIAFEPIEGGINGCCGARKAAQRWSAADAVGASLNDKSSKPSFVLFVCAIKRRKDGKAERRLQRIGPFACETAAAVEEAVTTIRQALRAHANGVTDGKTVLCIFNPFAGKGKYVHALRLATACALFPSCGSHACSGHWRAFVLSGGDGHIRHACMQFVCAFCSVLSQASSFITAERYCRASQVCQEVEAILASAGQACQVEATTHAQHATQLAGALDVTTIGCIAAIGGDGTFHEIVQVRASTVELCVAHASARQPYPRYNAWQLASLPCFLHL